MQAKTERKKKERMKIKEGEGEKGLKVWSLLIFIWVKFLKYYKTTGGVQTLNSCLCESIAYDNDVWQLCL